jgi:PAS domain-containing protein
MSDRDGFTNARAGMLVSGQAQALQLAVSGAPLAEVLDVLVRTAETQSDGSFLASILLLSEDGKHLRHGAAPSLPAAYNAAINGIEIGPAVGSCGTAAHFGHAIFVTDIARNALWANFRDLALEHGLRACWSTPFVSKQGAVLGTLALYYREPRGPTENDRDVVKLIGHTAGLVVENARLSADLHDRNQQARLAADAGGLGLFTWDVGTDEVTWHNERPYEIFGIPRSDAPVNAARFVAEFLLPQDQETFTAAGAASVNQGRPFHFEGRYRHHQTGATRWIELTGQLDPRLAVQARVRVVGIAADVTRRHEAP